MKHPILIACALMILWGYSAYALPTKIKVENTVWHAVGKSSLNFLFLDVYDIALYSENGRYDAALPYMLIIQYHREFSAGDIIDRSLSEMDMQSPLSEKKEALFHSYLKRVIPRVVKQDVIRAKMIPRIGIEFQVNNATPTLINDNDFAARFFDIWLGKKTSEPELRTLLLHEG